MNIDLDEIGIKDAIHLIGDLFVKLVKKFPFKEKQKKIMGIATEYIVRKLKENGVPPMESLVLATSIVEAVYAILEEEERKKVQEEEQKLSEELERGEEK